MFYVRFVVSAAFPMMHVIISLLESKYAHFFWVIDFSRRLVMTVILELARNRLPRYYQLSWSRIVHGLSWLKKVWCRFIAFISVVGFRTVLSIFTLKNWGKMIQLWRAYVLQLAWKLKAPACGEDSSWWIAEWNELRFFLPSKNEPSGGLRCPTSLWESQHLRLITAKNRVLVDFEQTLGEAEIQEGDCRYFNHNSAFALWCHGDSAFITWG